MRKQVSATVKNLVLCIMGGVKKCDGCRHKGVLEVFCCAASSDESVGERTFCAVIALCNGCCELPMIDKNVLSVLLSATSTSESSLVLITEPASSMTLVS